MQIISSNLEWSSTFFRGRVCVVVGLRSDIAAKVRAVQKFLANQFPPFF